MQSELLDLYRYLPTQQIPEIKNEAPSETVSTILVIEVVDCAVLAINLCLPCRVPTFRGQKVVKHGDHWGI